MSERFSGKITLDEGDEVDVDLELSDDEVRLATESAEIGVWPRPDCTFVDGGDGVYQLIVDDDVVTFVPTEHESFGRALEQGSNGRHSFEPEPPDVDSSIEEPSGADVAIDDLPVDDGSADETGAVESADTYDASVPDPAAQDAADVEAGEPILPDEDDDDGFFISVVPSSGDEHRDVESSPVEGEREDAPAVDGNPFILEDEPSSFTPLAANAVEEESGEDSEPIAHASSSSFFVGTDDREEQDAFTAVPAPAPESASGLEQPQASTADDGVDYEELAAWLEEMAEEQAAEAAEAEAEEVGDNDDAEPEVVDAGERELGERRGFGWFRGRTSKSDAAPDADEPEPSSTETGEEAPDDADARTGGWFVDPSIAAAEPEPDPEPAPVDDTPRVRSSTERLAAAVGALKEQRTLTPAEQAIAEAQGESRSVISTEEVLESQRSLRKSNVVRRLTWDLIRKVGAGMLLGLGIAVLVFLFPSAWDVLTRDAESTVVIEDPATSTTLDPGDTTATTAAGGATTTTAPSTSTTMTTAPPTIESVFDLPSQDFFERWNREAIPIGEVLAFGVYPPPGAFENEFYPYLSMIGTVGERGTLDGFGIVVDPTGPSDSDWLAIQALGVAIAVAEPDLTGGERADLLATLGLDVRQPQLGGIDGDLVRGPYRYRLVFDTETTLLTFTISRPGAPLPGSEGDG